MHLSIASFIPTSMGFLGAVLLLLAFPVQWITPQNSKGAIWMAFIGGFGVAGGAGGWFGGWLTGTAGTVASTSAKLTSQAVGAALPMLFFAVLAIFFVKHAGKGGSGLSGGKGKGAKAKQTAWLLAFALLGCAISAIPYLYSLADSAVSMAGTAVISLLP